MRKSALVILTAVMLAVVAASGAVAQEVNGSTRKPPLTSLIQDPSLCAIF